MFYFLKWLDNSLNFNIFTFINFKKNNLFFKKKYNFLSSFFKFKIKKIRKNYIGKTNLLSKFNLSDKLFEPRETRKIYDYKKMLFLLILENRKIVNIFLFNRTNAKKITKYFSKRLKLSTLKLFRTFKNMVFFILFSTKLIFSIRDLMFFISNELVFLNKKLIKNYFCVTTKNDIIAIIYNKYFYHYITYKQLNVYYSIKKFKWKHAFKIRINFSKINNKRFFNSKYFKSSIHFFYQTPRHLEIDYSILTIFIISNFIYDYENIWWTKFFSLYISHIYNWKHVS